MDTWETEQVAKLNTLADVDVRTRFDDLGGPFWVLVIVDNDERFNRRYKNAKSAMKAYLKESVRYSAVVRLLPKNSGRITLRVGRDLFLESTWREHAKMWI